MSTFQIVGLVEGEVGVASSPVQVNAVPSACVQLVALVFRRVADGGHHVPRADQHSLRIRQFRTLTAGLRHAHPWQLVRAVDTRADLLVALQGRVRCLHCMHDFQCSLLDFWRDGAPGRQKIATLDRPKLEQMAQDALA